MLYKDTYKLFMKSVYQTSSENAQYVYEYILLRGIELVSLLSEKKLPQEKLKAYSEYEISYDAKVLFATIKMVLETCTPKEIVKKMTDYNDILLYLNRVRVQETNKFFITYYQSRFFKSLSTLNLCENFEKAHRGRFPDEEDIRIAEGGIVDYDSSIYNLYVNAMRRSVESSEFFIKINRGHGIYDKIRCIDLKLPDNKKKDKNQAEILLLQVYEKLTCEILDFMRKYDYKYSEIICLLCLNFTLPDKIVQKASFREKLMAIKIQPFDKMPYKDAYSVFMSLNPEMSKNESENFEAYYSDIRKIITARGTVTRDARLNPRIVERSNVFTSFYADKTITKFIPEKRDANVVTSAGGFVSGYNDAKKDENSSDAAVNVRANLTKAPEEKKEETLTEKIFNDNYSDASTEDSEYYEDYDDRNWFTKMVDSIKDWISNNIR